MDIRAFTFGLFWTVVLWILVYRHLNIHMLLGIDVGGEFGGWLKTVGLSFWETAEVLYTEVVIIWQRRHWWPTPVLLPGKSHGRRSLIGCSPWGRWDSDRTERLPFHYSLLCIGEEMATHLSVLAWRIPGTAETGGLPSMGSHRVRHDWCNLAAAAAVPFDNPQNLGV